MRFSGRFYRFRHDGRLPCDHTPFAFAFDQGAGVEIVERLIRAGSDASVEDDQGDTPEDLAARSDGSGTIIQLLKKVR